MKWQLCIRKDENPHLYALLPPSLEDMFERPNVITLPNVIKCESVEAFKLQ
jgi:hypothetical protein